MRSYSGLTTTDLANDLESRLALADAAIDAAVGASTDPERLGHLDAVARHVNAGRGRSGSLASVHPDPAIREAANAALSRIAAWRAAAFSRSDLSRMLERIDDAALDVAQQGQVRLWRTYARVAGGHLDDARRAELATLDRACDRARDDDPGGVRRGRSSAGHRGTAPRRPAGGRGRVIRARRHAVDPPRARHLRRLGRDHARRVRSRRPRTALAPACRIAAAPTTPRGWPTCSASGDPSRSWLGSTPGPPSGRR